MKKFFVILAMTAVMTSCGLLSSTSPATTGNTRGEKYPKFYEEKPVVLLVMPPMNNTSYVEAKEYLYSSISLPLAEAGYYVISPFLAMDILRAESAYDTEMFVDAPLDKFREFFGCDAVVFSEIQEWSKVGTGIDVKVRYFIKSATNGEIMFDRTCDLYLDLDMELASSSSALGSLINLAASAINTAATGHIVAARKANHSIFMDIPRGKYHPSFMQDMDLPAGDQEIKVVTK